MAWIKTEDVYQNWLEVVNNDGETLGYIRHTDARRANIRTITIEKPQKFVKDPYVGYHIEILMRSGLLTSGRDLNEVQTVLLLGYIINEKKESTELRKIDFEQLLFVNNPEMYKNYKEQEEQRRLAENPEYQQLRPQSLQELLAMFETFDEAASSTQDKQGQPIGWLDDLLDDEEASQLRD